MAELDVPESMPVPIRVWEGGAVRVGTTRVNLWQVVGHHLEGLSPEEMVEQYPTLELADVYGAIAFYLRHRETVDAYLAEEERRGEELRQRIESQPGYRESIARMKARWAEMQAGARR